MIARFFPSFSDSCRSLSRFGFILLIVFCVPRKLLGQTWKALGPAGGDVRALAVAPSDPQVIYLGTTDGHIFVSRDAGERWELAGRIGDGQKAIVTSILVGSRDSQELFASTWTKEMNGEAGGVYRSVDGGRTWRESGLAGHAVRALVAAPSNPGIFVAGALDGVFRSLDSGESWRRISPENDPELRNFDSLAVDPQNPETIYAGTFHLPWKTTDGGANWTSIHRGMIDDSDVLSFAVDPEDPARILASACSGIYRSLDSGSVWQKIQGIPYSSRRTLVIRIDPANPEIFFAGTTEGLWKTMNRGASWLRISPAGWVVNALAITSPAEADRGRLGSSRQDRLLIGTEQQGILLSDDAGQHFRAANDGFFHRRISSLAMDPATPGHIAAVVTDAPLPIVESVDRGESWLPLGAAEELTDARRIFWTPAGWRVARASGGFARWDAANQKWARVGDLQETAARVRPLEGGNAIAREKRPFLSFITDLAFSNTQWFAATADGVFASADKGISWSALPAAAFGLPADSVHVSRDGRRLRVVSSGGMIFSDDAGLTTYWRDLPFDSGGVQRMEFADETTILATSRTGVYISSDGGSNWKKIQNGLPAAPVADLFLHAEFWLVEMGTGDFYLSEDRGLNWLRLGEIGSTVSNLRGLQAAIDRAGKDPDSIYAPSASDGLFMLDLQQPAAAASLIPSGK
jgi:photosystem II stability/assembly factor-like uncharacterized protein